MKNYRVVVVNYDKADSIKSLLSQLNLQTIPPSSVAIIDNSSNYSFGVNDIDEYDFKIEISHHPENIGYSKACNFGASGDWDYVVFLNPDIGIQDQRLFEDLLQKVAGINNLGCAGVAQLNPDGTYERVARKYPSLTAILGKRVPVMRGLLSESVTIYMDSYSCDYSPTAEPIAVDWLQSSFLLVPRAVWKKYGGFEERFFVFMADTEYGLRCKRNGLTSYLFRSLRVDADGLRSSAGGVLDIVKKKTIRIHLRDAFRYYTGL